MSHSNCSLSLKPQCKREPFRCHRVWDGMRNAGWIWKADIPEYDLGVWWTGFDNTKQTQVGTFNFYLEFDMTGVAHTNGTTYIPCKWTSYGQAIHDQRVSGEFQSYNSLEGTVPWPNWVHTLLDNVPNVPSIPLLPKPVEGLDVTVSRRVKLELSFIEKSYNEDGTFKEDSHFLLFVDMSNSYAYYNADHTQRTERTILPGVIFHYKNYTMKSTPELGESVRFERDLPTDLIDRIEFPNPYGWLTGVTEAEFYGHPGFDALIWQLGGNDVWPPYIYPPYIDLTPVEIIPR